MMPIPFDARHDDVRWEPAFLQLAQELIRLYAKPRVIGRFTGLSSRRIRRMYRDWHGAPAPSGPVIQASARFFAIPSAWTSSQWNIECATLIACFEDVGQACGIVPNRGWQLVMAFTAYTNLWQTTDQGRSRRMDINLAYALLSHAGFLESREAELQRRRCPNCMLRFLVVRSIAPERQRCPVCSIDANHQRLAKQGFGG